MLTMTEYLTQLNERLQAVEQVTEDHNKYINEIGPYIPRFSKSTNESLDGLNLAICHLLAPVYRDDNSKEFLRQIIVRLEKSAHDRPGRAQALAILEAILESSISAQTEPPEPPKPPILRVIQGGKEHK